MQKAREQNLPKAIVYPKLEQLQWWNEPKLALLRHVEVINERHQPLAPRRGKHTLHTEQTMVLGQSTDAALSIKLIECQAAACCMLRCQAVRQGRAAVLQQPSQSTNH